MKKKCLRTLSVNDSTCPIIIILGVWEGNCRSTPNNLLPHNPINSESAAGKKQCFHADFTTVTVKDRR